jgi:hypothetical protein
VTGKCYNRKQSKYFLDKESELIEMKNEKQELKEQVQQEEMLSLEELEQVSGGLAPTRPIRLGLVAGDADTDANLIVRRPHTELKKI